MPNSIQVLCALALAVWVVDVRFAPKPVSSQIEAEVSSCHNGPSVQAPAGSDLEFVVCAPRGK